MIDLFHIIQSIISGRNRHIIIPFRFPLVELNMDGIQYRLIAHRLYNSAGSQNGNAADNAKARIKGLLCKLLSSRHGNLDLQDSLIIQKVAYLQYFLRNHFPRYMIDCRISYRLVESRLCHSPDARSTVNENLCLCPFFTGIRLIFRKRHSGNNPGTGCDIGIVPAILYDRTGNGALFPLYIGNLRGVRNSFGRINRDFCFFHSGKKHIGGCLGSGCCTASCRKTVSHLFVLNLSSIPWFVSVICQPYFNLYESFIKVTIQPILS